MVNSAEVFVRYWVFVNGSLRRNLATVPWPWDNVFPTSRLLAPVDHPVGPTLLP